MDLNVPADSDYDSGIVTRGSNRSHWATERVASAGPE
jgi:hypothetical protein